MYWKDFELKVLYFSKKLNIEILDLLKWKFQDIITGMKLMDILEEENMINVRKFETKDKI